MKKILISAAVMLCSLAALAQAPAAYVAPKAAMERKQDIKVKQHDANDDHNHDKATKPSNHGQTVSTFAKTTTLTGANKGAAVSAIARNGRSSGQGQRAACAPRSARGGEHGQRGSRPTGNSHAASGHADAGAGHGRGR